MAAAKSNPCYTLCSASPETQYLPWPFKTQLNKALGDRLCGLMAWSVGCAERWPEEGFTISKTPVRRKKTRADKKKNKRTGCCATWGTCKLFSTSAEGVESRTRNPGMMLVKCFNGLEVIFQYIFSWHQQTLHNGYYITALQQQILSFALFVWYFFSFFLSLSFSSRPSPQWRIDQ